MQVVLFLFTIVAIILLRTPSNKNSHEKTTRVGFTDTLLPLTDAGTLHTSDLEVSIDSLKPGQHYFISVESAGCFHHTKNYLTISRQNEGYHAIYKMDGVDAKSAKTWLLPYQLDAVRSFERQLKSISATKGYCTTVATFQLQIGNLKDIYTVDNCEWKGMGKLLNVLFGNQE